MEQGWVWVSLHYATYGVRHNATHVIDAAPIAAWMVGKTNEEVIAWLYKKDPNVKFVPL